MLLYDHKAIEAKWQKHWAENKTFKASNTSDKPKFYALDMFPYPSGAGLHVGHPLGYIASDIVSRYKRHAGFNVLHPMGYDSFGLPAEQYAIQTGQHPAETTKTNIEGGTDKSGNKIAGYRNQMDRIGFSFDWDREVRTSSPDYYKYTQEIFIMLFNSWYDNDADKAQPISLLESRFRESGTNNINAATEEDLRQFTAAEWNAFTDKEQQEILLDYRLTFLANTEVNWCPGLGTVLANDEIVNGVSERGGHPVVRKKMRQWMMRISAFAERLLTGLDGLDWAESIKEIQRNWIGKSVGAMVSFQLGEHKIDVFTTRPDTIYGVTFMTLAPEHELVDQITTAAQKDAVEAYKKATAARSERERMADVKTISGVFTGAYATHPLSGEQVPVWIGDYVLAGYGTGAVMAVPCGDERDYAFANYFAGQEGMPAIKNIFDGVDISEEAYGAKDKTPLCNSDFLNGMSYKQAMYTAIQKLEEIGSGKGKTNYRLRDAVFSRQRYWGEPFPVYYKDGLPQMIDNKYLPIALPEVDEYLPTEDGAPPLGRATTWSWCTQENKVVSNDDDRDCVYPLELNTMPGWAGSSWYMFRYMDATNENEMFSKEAQEYWNNVDLYIGGSEHATGHLLYSRFWVKLLHDLGKVTVEEPFQKMINQGMILGESAFVNYLDIGYKNQEGQFKQLVCQIIINSSYAKTLPEEGFITGLPQILIDHIIETTDSYRKFNKVPDDIILIFKNFRSSHLPVEYVNLDNTVNLSDIPVSERFRWTQNAYYFNDNTLTRSDKIDTLREVEKMSKSKFNVVNPDNICDQYGADTLRLYEMFLGPLEQAKPWNTAGITGVYGFMKKLWKLYHNDAGFSVSEEKASPDSMKTLHKTIKKVQDDIESFSFNTSVSSFMIAVNELTQQKCSSREVLEPLAVLISPYAPHIAEELWSLLGHKESISEAPFPVFDEKHLVESSKTYPISFNGKMKFTLDLPVDVSKDELEKMVLANEKVQEQLEGKQIRKTIIVPGKIVNFVVG
ncbi:class I tRNA ligase family protein [Nonlabens sp.]|uniref:leucine--tRNA ligase n=1 Tax=Nonlabens sp. TaxID=1888209 RepID=UPI0032661BC1